MRVEIERGFHGILDVFLLRPGNRKRRCEGDGNRLTHVALRLFFGVMDSCGGFFILALAAAVEAASAGDEVTVNIDSTSFASRKRF